MGNQKMCGHMLGQYNGECWFPNKAWKTWRNGIFW